MKDSSPRKLRDRGHWVSGTGVKAGVRYTAKIRGGGLKVCPHILYLLPAKHSIHSPSHFCLWRNQGREILRTTIPGAWGVGEEDGPSKHLTENEGIIGKTPLPPLLFHWAPRMPQAIVYPQGRTPEDSVHGKWKVLEKRPTDAIFWDSLK